MSVVFEQDSLFPDVLLIKTKRFEDARGYFTETLNCEVWAAAGFSHQFVQENESYSSRKGTVRGLHFQLNPMAQDKLVRCTSGEILDVVVDIRRDSKTFKQHRTFLLSGKNGHQLFVPKGFAHGFCTLTTDCLVSYKVTNVYSPQHDAGVAHDDPDFGIEWPFPRDELTLSDKDATLPRLKDCSVDFSVEPTEKEPAC